MKTFWLWAGVAGLWSSVAAWGQAVPGAYAWEEFSKRIKASEKVEPLGPNFAGEEVSLSNGGLSFSATDVSLPGNSALKVEFRRTYSVFSRKDYVDLGMLADWVVDVPSISGVFAPDWVVGVNYTTNRCSDTSRPRVEDWMFDTEDFWQGLQLNIPGVSSGELLRTQANVAKPTDGATYYWLTNERVHVSCLTTIKNPGTGNGTGQAFLARTADGTRYWFDWMGQTPEPRTSQLEHRPDSTRVGHTLVREKNYLYATRVEDRFGNYVNYTYTNAWNAPGKLTKIEASDGRSLTITYVGATISNVTDGTRTWSYEYDTTTSGRKTLKKVTLPDTSAWTIGLGAFTNAEIKYNEFLPMGEPVRSCTFNEFPLNLATTFVGTMTHPAGATAEFTLGIQEHGRSWVPVNCRNFTTTFPTGPNRGSDNDPNDDVNLYATSAYSLTLKQKKVNGPGLTEAVWNYSYEANAFPAYFYPGTTFKWPICDYNNGVDCSLPPCTNDDCAKYSVTTVSGPGEWQRYRHGNTYRYNEGKLLQVETGTGPSDIQRVVTYSYDLSRVDQVYPARFGTSMRQEGEGFASEYHRPETAVETIQQGTSFKRQIDQFDDVARPTQITRVSAASGGSNPPPPPPISTPTLTAPANSVAGQVHVLSWTSVSGAVLYAVERSIDNGTYATIYSGADLSSELMYPSDATLKYRIRACGAYGQCSAYSAIKTVVVAAPVSLAAPTMNAPQFGYRGSLFGINWTSVAGAAKYIVERRVSSSGSFVSIYVGTGNNTMSSYPRAETLYFRVKACDAATNCGAYSNIDSTQVLDQDEP